MKRCSECNREFIPDHRVGDRQITCGSPECRKSRIRARARERYHTDDEYRAKLRGYIRDWYYRNRGTPEFRDRARASDRRYREKHRDDPKYLERRRAADRKRRLKNPRAGKAEKDIVLDEREQSIFEKLKKLAQASDSAN